MKTLNALLAAICLFAASANATLINPSGVVFNELGKTTIDTNTGLEWLDLTETVGIPFHDVLNMLQDVNSPINKYDGWRFATRIDFSNLVENWWGIPFQADGYFNHDQYFPFDGEDAKVEFFISTFGDAGAKFYGLYAPDVTSISTFITGWLSESGDSQGVSSASIYDQDLILNTTGDTYRSNDYLLVYAMGDLPETVSPHVASYLVRCSLADSNACTTGTLPKQTWYVSEPAAPFLFLVGVFALLAVRRRQKM